MGPPTGPTPQVGPPGSRYDHRRADSGAHATVYGDVYGDAYPGTTYGGSAYGDSGLADDFFGDPYDDEDPEDDGGSGRGRWARLGMVLAVTFAVLVLVLLAAGFWVSRQIDPGGAPGDEVTVELERGQSTAEIAQVLADHDVISDARIFTVYARFRSQGDIQAGRYQDLRTNMSMADVLDRLAAGPDGNQATVAPGRTVDQMLASLAEESPAFEEDALRQALAEDVELRHLPEGQENPEGMLFPDTYEVDESVTEAEFLQTMVDRFDEVYEDLGVDQRAGQIPAGDVQISPYDVVIVASMIEREAGVDEDRPRIARVIYNRLAAGSPLAIDSTSCYLKEESPCELTAEDLQSDSPYNTREQTGLPPTPIASPGRASMEAALEPAEGDWFYYVLDVEAGDGSHLFTSDRDEFNAARDRCEEAGRCG